MKIVQIPAYMDSYQRSLVHALRKRGHDVRYGQTKQFFSMIELSLFFNVIRYYKVDVIHLHWQHAFLLGNNKVGTTIKSLLFIIQLLIIKATGVRVVWTVHNLKNHENYHKELEIYFTGKIAKYTDRIIVHCEASKQIIIKKFKIPDRKISVIPIGNFIDIYKNTTARNEARNQLKIKLNDFLFLSLGLVRPYKGIVDLIDNFNKLENAEAKLIIAGKVSGSQLKDVIMQKTKNIPAIRLVFEYIHDDEVQFYMNAADIIVLPYREILNSGGVVAGMSFGKPIIAPSIGCIPEVLDSNGGFLYDPEQTNGLLNAMKQAIDSKNCLQQMGFYNHEIAKKWDWEDIAGATSEVYKNN